MCIVLIFIRGVNVENNLQSIQNYPKVRKVSEREGKKINIIVGKLTNSTKIYYSFFQNLELRKVLKVVFTQATQFLFKTRVHFLHSL